MASAGKFKIEVADPYPAWFTVSYDGHMLNHGIHHKELSDLEYAVRKAMQEARDKLRGIKLEGGRTAADEIGLESVP